MAVKKRRRRGTTPVSGNRRIPFRESGGPRVQPARTGPVRSPRPDMPYPATAGFTAPKVPTASSINLAPQAMSGGVGSYNIEADPAVAAARGLSAKIRAQAQATALAKRIQAATEYGSAEGLEKDLGGQYGATQKAASENPYSVQKQLDRNYTTGVSDLEEQLNQAGLFYSGYRGQQLGEAGHAFGQSKYNAATAYRGLLSDINENLANALLNADAMDIAAMQGSTGGGYGGGDGEPGGDPNTQYPRGSAIWPVVTSGASIRGTTARQAPVRQPIVSPTRRTAVYRPGRRTQGGV